MTVAALPGNVRLRAFQIGPQPTFGTPVIATRRLGLTYMPTTDPHWTFPASDTGTLDQALPPYRTATDVTGSLTGPLCYDDAPYLYGALIKGGVTPAVNVWTYTPASTSQDSFELFSGEWGDDVAADNFGYGDGVLDSLQLVYPEDLSPIQVTAGWRFGTVVTPQTKQVLSVDPSPVWVYAAHTSLYINDTAGTIGTTKLTNTMHSATITINNNLDVKRFANGSNTAFAVAGYGRGARTFTAEFHLAKSTAGVAEAAKWLNANAQTRYMSVETISPTLIPTTVIPYSHKLRFAGFWFTRTESTYGTANATITLVCNGYYDPTLTYPFTAAVATKLSAY